MHQAIRNLAAHHRRRYLQSLHLLAESVAAEIEAIQAGEPQPLCLGPLESASANALAQGHSLAALMSIDCEAPSSPNRSHHASPV